MFFGSVKQIAQLLWLPPPSTDSPLLVSGAMQHINNIRLVQKCTKILFDSDFILVQVCNIIIIVFMNYNYIYIYRNLRNPSFDVISIRQSKHFFILLPQPFIGGKRNQFESL